MTPQAPVVAPRILVVDDETIVRESLGAWFAEDGFAVDTASGGSEALKLLADRRYDIALLDIKMPKMNGLELQAHIARASPETTVIIMTAFASVETAVKALKAGAYDYIVKPFDPDELSHLIARAREHRSLLSENVRLKRSLDANVAPSGLVGNSPAMRKVDQLIDTVAPADTTVLILGESGTGKEVVAREIHTRSPRRYNPMVMAHLGALAEGVLESELFGHEKGAFTGARYHHKGKFEQADGGTIFLDEIGDISPRVQIELLRVLEEKSVTRVGGKQTIPTDFRVLAATNKDLDAMVREGTFREDLFWRLNVVTIDLPPLRERRGDIQPLAEHFLERLSRSMNRRGLVFSKAALDLLVSYDWPGNVRELQNAVERAVVFGRPPEVLPKDLPGFVRGAAGGPGLPIAVEARALADVEREHIKAVLEETGWQITKAAGILDVDRGTLYNKIKRFGLQRPESDAG
jgi:two-component system response regulator HydG